MQKDEGANLYFQQGEIFTQSNKNIISFSISDHARNIIFKDEIKLQYEIDTGNYSLWHEAANKLLDQKADASSDISKLRLTGWDDDYFASESAYEALFLLGILEFNRLHHTTQLWKNGIMTQIRISATVLLRG